MIDRYRILRLCLALSVPGGLLGSEATGTVRDFGAVGDGHADDSAAIQKAVDAGGTVRFPAGTFRLTRTVRIDLEKSGIISLVGDGATVVEMAGRGPAFQFVGTVKGTAAPSDFPVGFWNRQDAPSISGLSIVGSNAQAVGLEIVRVMQMVISKCEFRQLRDGIHFLERDRNAIISDCNVYNNSGIGIYFDHVNFHQVNISNSHISYNRGGGIVGRGGAIRNLQIGTCDIEANVGGDEPPTANILLDSTGGSIGEVEITGCTIQHLPNRPGFANIRYIGECIPVRFTPEKRLGNFVVTGNMLNDADVDIQLSGARGAVISGNAISLGTAHDILVENSSQVVLADNVLDRHPRYHPDRKLAWGPIKQGIVFKNCDSCTLSGLRINGGQAPAAIEILGGSRFNITGCSVTGVDGAGLRLENVKDSLVTANLFEVSAQGRHALVVSGGSGNLVEGNLIKGSSEIDSP